MLDRDTRQKAAGRLTTPLFILRFRHFLDAPGRCVLMFPPVYKVSEMSFKASLVPAAVIITDAADGP